MKIKYENGIFICESTYEELKVPKGIGFRWNRDSKSWETQDWKIAEKLLQYADDVAREEIEKSRVDEQKIIEASRAGELDIEIPKPAGLEYLPFQKAGIAYGLKRASVLYADEMGLGKTIEAIGIINADNSLKKVLIICPASLKLNWKREMEKWLVHPQPIGIANGDSYPETEMLILNYDILKKYHNRISQIEWDALIVDEAHYLKNPKAQRTQFVLGKRDRDPQRVIQPIKARRKIFLTGTPIVNRPIELWPIAHALVPEVFENWRQYVIRYCAAFHSRWGWEVKGASHLDELQEKLRANFMVRRMKKDVLTELPPKRRQVIELPANGAAQVIQAEKEGWKWHETRLAELKRRVEIAKASADPTEYDREVMALREGTMAAFAEISKLRHKTAVAKIPQVIDFLHTSLDDGDGKIVLFAHHHDVIDAIQKEFGSLAVILTGETSQEDRQKAVDQFQGNPEIKLFIGSITAAGLGITLTASSHVIFAELDWVPGNISQSEDRLHRIGQANSVLVQHLVLEGSLDAIMAHRLIEKQEIIDEALNRNELITQTDMILPELAKKEPKRNPDEGQPTLF